LRIPGEQVAVAQTQKLSMDIASENGGSSTATRAQPRMLRPRLSDAGGVASPTHREHAMQRRRRWSPRATLAVSGGAGLLIWGAIALAISAIR